MLLGVTFSTPEDLKSWAGENSLTTDLLSDGDRTVALAWGAAETADQERPTRLSVLIGPDGAVRKVYEKPDPGTHPAEVLADLA